VVGRTVDRSLTTKLFQHLCGTSKSISRLSDGNVQDDLLNAQLLHRIAFLSGFCHFDYGEGNCRGVVVDLELRFTKSSLMDLINPVCGDPFLSWAWR